MSARRVTWSSSRCVASIARCSHLVPDGTRLWSGAVELGEAVVKNSRLYLQHEDAIHLMDPRTGDVVRSVAGDFATVDPARPAVIVEVGEFDEVTFFDFDLQPVFGPELFDAEEPLFADFDGAVIVAVADDRLEYRRDRRRVIREVSIDPDLDIEGVLAVEPDLVVSKRRMSRSAGSTRAARSPSSCGGV